MAMATIFIPIHADELNKVDTIFLTVSSAEQRFVQKNLTLLINKFNIDIAQDNLLQAKLWYNPNLNYGTTLYNVQAHRFFSDYYPTSQFSDENFQIQQLVTLAGRHQATWNLAEVGVKQARFQLLDILRNLKYQLHTDISDLYYNQQLLKIYQTEEQALVHMIEVTKSLYEKGNAAGNEVIQLQAQLQDVAAQEMTSKQAVISDEQDLKILLMYPITTTFIAKALPLPPTDSTCIPPYKILLDSALKNRPDLLLAYAGDEYAKKNLHLQYTTALPDLTIGMQYSGVNASAAAYTGIYGTMDIPLFNRNQWNIQGAKDGLTQSLLSDTLALVTVQHQLFSSYTQLNFIRKQFLTIEKGYGIKYNADLDEMMSNAVQNYDKRLINLLTLLSLINSYADGKTNWLNLQVQYFNAIKNVNLNTAVEIIK